MKSMSKLEIVKLFFEDKEETLDVINSGGDLLKYLTGKNVLCPLIGTEIKLNKVLGKGEGGIVFEISFSDSEKKKYAVKKSKIYNFDESSKPRLYKRLDNREEIVIPPGSSICEKEYSEYAISLLVGELVRNGTCINFMDVFAFSMCPNPGGKSFSQYTFMEQIDSSVRKDMGCIMEDLYGPGGPSGPSNPYGKVGKGLNTKQRRILTNSVLIQTLFALAVLDRTYQIVHGDLHDDNIFLVHDPDFIWNGKRIGDYDYYRYKIDKTSIYLPGIPLIVKIGDLGLAVKYSAPMIGNITTMENGYYQYDGKGPWLPNFYTPAYDTTFIVSIFRNRNPSNEFIKQITAWVFGLKTGYKANDINVAMENLMAATGRPKISELENKLKHVSSEAILLNKKLMKDYLIPPPKGSKVLTIGKI